jgi:hypothetical protein
VLLERINMNTVRLIACPFLFILTESQTKTIELMGEVNQCITELFRANQNVRTVSSLTEKYRKNVRYNLSNARADSAMTSGSTISQ